MNEQAKAILKSKIDQAALVSFEAFGTLLYRRTNAPYTIFDLVGQHFHLDGFRKLRMDCQNEADRRASAANQGPCADLAGIYAVLREHTEVTADWDAMMDYELQMERDALAANRDMLEFFWYAKAGGKRVIVTSDAHFTAAQLAGILEQNVFAGVDHIYCAPDEHQAKCGGALFRRVVCAEGIACGRILHVGNSQRDDVQAVSYTHSPSPRDS